MNFVVYFLLSVAALAIAFFVVWLYWLAASWLVDSVLGWRNIWGFFLKVFLVFIIQGLVKAFRTWRHSRDKPDEREFD